MIRISFDPHGPARSDDHTVGGGVGFFSTLSAVTAWSMSSSIPETPFLNSVTLLPSERITLGRRLPKISSETNATTINSVAPKLGRKANGNMGGLLKSSGRRGRPASATAKLVRVGSMRRHR